MLNRVKILVEKDSVLSIVKTEYASYGKNLINRLEKNIKYAWVYSSATGFSNPFLLSIRNFSTILFVGYAIPNLGNLLPLRFYCSHVLLCS